MEDEEMEITQEDIDNKLSCSICLDEFKLGEKVHELPCKPNKHYFHVKNKNCDGIKPWLSHNNTCPMCRFELPISKRENIDQEEDIDNSTINMPSDMPPDMPIERQQELNQALTPEQVVDEGSQNLNDILRTILIRRNYQQIINTNLNTNLNNIMLQMDTIRDGFSDSDIDEALRRSLED